MNRLEAISPIDARYDKYKEKTKRRLEVSKK